MHVVIDVGNTKTMIGAIDGDEIRNTFRISSHARTTDELGMRFVQLLAFRGISPDDVEGGIVSCVVPSLQYNVEKACRRYLGFEPLVVGKRLKTGMKVRTDNPREVGADRIVNAVAAIHRWGGPVVVVDFGTATTFDCVNAGEEYVGGAIAPGLQIAEEALFSKTAKLPRVEMANPGAAIGRNTVHAMQSGLFWGYLGLVDSLARRCRSELDPEARVVATGGLSSLFAPDSTEIQEVDPFLTLRGLSLLYHRNAAP